MILRERPYSLPENVHGGISFLQQGQSAAQIKPTLLKILIDQNCLVKKALGLLVFFELKIITAKNVIGQIVAWIVLCHVGGNAVDFCDHFFLSQNLQVK